MLNALLFLFVLLVNAPCFQQPLLFCVVLGGVKRQARLEIFFKYCVRKLCCWHKMIFSSISFKLRPFQRSIQKHTTWKWMRQQHSIFYDESSVMKSLQVKRANSCFSTQFQSDGVSFGHLGSLFVIFDRQLR